MARWGSPEWQGMHWSYRWIKRVFHHPLRLGLGIQAKGWENVPATGPVLLVSNHFSWADPVLLGAVVGRPTHFLGKHTLFHKGPLGWLLRSTQMIPVDRAAGGNEAAVDAAVAFLERGRPVGVYPEGTRSVFPELRAFKTGAVRMALRTGAPIVPVASLTDRFWPVGRTFFRPWHPPYVNFGVPYTLGRHPELAADRDYCRKASDDLQRRVTDLLAVAALARDRRERWRYR